MIELKKSIVYLLTELRNENNWNDNLWKYVYNELSINSNIWKISGNVPKGIIPYISNLISALAGGSKFIDENTSLKIEDAEIKLLELFAELEDDNDKDFI